MSQRLMFSTMARCALALVLSVAALSSTTLVPAGAQETPVVRVIDFGAESQFPDYLRFWASVESDAEVEDIRVNFTVGARGTTQYNYLELATNPSTNIVDGEFLHRVDTTDRYIPPGATVRYWLEIFDSTGATHLSETREMVMTDARWDNWESVTDGPVTVYYRITRTRAEALARASREALEKMGPVTGSDISDPITMTLYNNNADMIGAVVGRSGATSRELITEGQAFAEENVVLVLAGRNDIGTATHEITHILVGRAAGGSAFVPLWLNEGLAEYGNLDPTVSYTRYLEWAIDTDRLTPLRNLRSFPGDPNLTLVAYGQARSAVAYMIDTYGPEKMSELLGILGTGRPIDLAMRDVYGMGVDDFDDEWRASIGADPVPPPPTPTPTSTPAPDPTPTTEGDAGKGTQAGETVEPVATAEAVTSSACNSLPGGPLPLANIAGLAALGMVGAWRAARRSSPPAEGEGQDRR